MRPTTGYYDNPFNLCSILPSAASRENPSPSNEASADVTGSEGARRDRAIPILKEDGKIRVCPCEKRCRRHLHMGGGNIVGKACFPGNISGSHVRGATPFHKDIRVPKKEPQEQEPSPIPAVSKSPRIASDKDIRPIKCQNFSQPLLLSPSRSTSLFSDVYRNESKRVQE